MREYVTMNVQDVEKLDREKTVFLMSVSPIEAHGPHLPLGTDVFVAEDLQKRYVEALENEVSGYTFVKLPPLFMGADALPFKGSISVPAPVLKDALFAFGKGLAEQGFRYLFLSDNHGGPRHQLGIEQAARKLWKKHGFYMINPFGLVFKMMVQHDQDFMKKVGLEEGKMGDDADAHAGTNETSLMLAVAPEMIDGDYADVAPSDPPPPQPLIRSLSGFLGKFSSQLGKDLEHLANVMAWVSDPDMKPYLGFPATASAEAGEAMLKARVGVAMELFRKALRGEPAHITPMLWAMKFLYKLPE